MSADAETKTKTVLVTGANSGVGFETAFRLAGARFGKVILACRTNEKAAIARQQLVARGAVDVFEPLAVDLSEVPSAVAAGDEVVARGTKLDLLLLNAGIAGGGSVARSSDGVDVTFASSLVGHHAMTMRLLAGRAFADDARIVIAGSEASRGDVMGMTIPDLDAIARGAFGDRVDQMLEAIARASYPPKYDASTAYALAKLYAAFWAAEMAPRLPKGMAVFAVSPGNTPTTNMGRNLPWPVRRIVFPALGALGPLVGMAHSVEKASERYIEAAGFDTGRSGRFFASPPGKLTGPMVEQGTRWLHDRGKQGAAYKVIVKLAGGLDCGD